MKKETTSDKILVKGREGAELMGPIDQLTILILSTHERENLRSFSQNVTICYYSENGTKWHTLGLDGTLL